MSERPLVSVVIPTYYRNDRLQKTLDCVFQQTYDPVEVIVVDDSGERHAEPVVGEYDSIEYIALEENRGPNRERTAGVQASAGEYVQLLDDDDRLFEEKIERQMSVFRENPNLVVVYSGGVYEGGEPFLPTPDARGDVLEWALTFQLPACITSSMLIQREALSDVIPLPDPPGSDDTYLKIELAERGEFDFVREPLLLKGEDPNARSYSEGAVEGTREVLTVYADLYDRFPPHVRDKAIATADYRRGKYLLRTSCWSPAAIRYIVRAYRRTGEANPRYLAMLLVALFGNAGFTAQRHGKRLVRRLLH